MSRIMTVGRARMTRALAALIATLIALVPVAASGVGRDPSELQRWLDQVVGNGVPAVAGVITRGESVEYYGGSGTVDGAPVNENTPFRIESLSKSFTATAVMQLVESGHVELDAPAIRYLPNLHIDDPRAGSITVRHLLNQSSGITDATLGFDQYAPGPKTAAEAGALLAGSHLGFDPGTDWAYSNPNYWLLSWLVEEVSGVPLETYLQREVFSPLSMNDTTAAATGAAVTGAPGHAHAFGIPVPVRGPDAFVSGAGGITSTTHDLARWLRFQQGRLATGKRVLSSASLAEMHRRQAPGGGLYALGWYSGPPADGGIERVSHSGAGAGVGAYQGLFPDGTAIAVIEASGAPAPYSIAERLLAAESGGDLGAPVSGPGPMRDGVLTLVALTVLAPCVRGIVRSRRWAGRVRRFRAGASIATGLIVTAALITAPLWATHLVGRAANWHVLFTAAPVPVVCVLVVAASVALLVIARATGLWRAMITARAA